ncbi:hypothetical protein WJX81_007670 [Elliptochloris bilobata]|uniref:NAC domain-containing protein n=1 Tax=Elliptochloris bilobata TaxID=381761 RepID=A0AAW1SEX2_9CHLO
MATLPAASPGIAPPHGLFSPPPLQAASPAPAAGESVTPARAGRSGASLASSLASGLTSDASAAGTGKQRARHPSTAGPPPWPFPSRGDVLLFVKGSRLAEYKVRQKPRPRAGGGGDVWRCKAMPLFAEDLGDTLGRGADPESGHALNLAAARFRPGATALAAEGDWCYKDGRVPAGDAENVAPNLLGPIAE